MSSRQPPEPDALTIAVRHLMRAADAATEATARRLGASRTELAALDHLSDAPLGPVELGERLGMTSASATALVDRLEARGHVERRPHPRDRRRLVLEETPHAFEEGWRALRPLVEAVERAGAELTDDERAVVARYLERLTAALEASARAS